MYVCMCMCVYVCVCVRACVCVCVCVWISAETIIRLFDYSVGMTLFNLLTHTIRIIVSTLYIVFSWKTQP